MIDHSFISMTELFICYALRLTIFFHDWAFHLLCFMIDHSFFPMIELFISCASWLAIVFLLAICESVKLFPVNHDVLWKLFCMKCKIGMIISHETWADPPPFPSAIIPRNAKYVSLFCIKYILSCKIKNKYTENLLLPGCTDLWSMQVHHHVRVED